jgi:hypothetical protein
MKSDDEMKMREWNKARTKPPWHLELGPGDGDKVYDCTCRSLCLARQIAQVSKEGIRFPS